MAKNQNLSSKKDSSKTKSIVLYSSLAGFAVITAVILSVLLMKKKKPVVETNPNVSVAQPTINQVYVPEKLMGSWSYYNANFNDPWTVEDFFFIDTDGKSKLWQNFLLTDGYPSWDFYGQVWNEIYRRTGIKLLVFWKPTAGIINATNLETFDQNYKQMVAKYPDLPAQPSGMLMYDEPGSALILGDNSNWGIVTASQMIKQKYPSILLYCNFTYDAITTQNSQAMGQSELDYISSDQYYDIPVTTYINRYNTVLYPNIKTTQKILLLPFAAYYEISTPNTTIVPTTADNTCLNTIAASAKNYKAWMDIDTRIVGMNIYRLKNLWWPNTTGASILSNPNGTGLGLVDRITKGGDYIMPDTVAFYQNLGTDWSKGIYDITK
jgi:hypothetical protein